MTISDEKSKIFLRVLKELPEGFTEGELRLKISENPEEAILFSTYPSYTIDNNRDSIDDIIESHILLERMEVRGGRYYLTETGMNYINREYKRWKDKANEMSIL